MGQSAEIFFVIADNYHPQVKSLETKFASGMLTFIDARRQFGKVADKRGNIMTPCNIYVFPIVNKIAKRIASLLQ